MDLILRRLVRNNGWVLQRYAPDEELAERLEENETRYRAIADNERARIGFEAGLGELNATVEAQTRTPMDRATWDRFTGLAAARDALRAARDRSPFERAQIVEHGKNAWAVERALQELGVEVVDDADGARVIGTMSPGPMLDAAAEGGAIMPWTVPDAPGERRFAA